MDNYKMAYSAVDKPDEMKPVSVAAPKVSSSGSRSGGKMTDAQKSALKKHMDKLKKGGMSASEVKSHRMKMMARMRRGMSVAKAHKDI